jgi:hypothetical protein
MGSGPIGEDLKINLPHRSGVMKKIGFFPVDLEALDVGGLWPRCQLKMCFNSGHVVARAEGVKSPGIHPRRTT